MRARRGGSCRRSPAGRRRRRLPGGRGPCRGPRRRRTCAGAARRRRGCRRRCRTPSRRSRRAAAATQRGERRRRGRRRTRARQRDSVRCHESVANLMKLGGRGGARGARRGGPRLPQMPAAGRLARGGGGRPAEALPRPGLLGAAGQRLRRPGGADPRSSASPPPPTAPTAPAGCSPATAPATGSTRRCTGPGSPTSRPRISRDDGLRLRDAYVTAVVRCAPPANKPTPEERDNCLPYLERELELLDRARVVVALGKFGWDGFLRAARALGVPAPRPKPRFGHGAEAELERPLHPARLLPPEPAEHLHRQADDADDRRRLRPRGELAAA